MDQKGTDVEKEEMYMVRSQEEMKATDNEIQKSRAIIHSVK